jgi:hypothetical protein
MNDAVIYIGKYSPILMGIQNVTLKNKFENLIFIETSLPKSRISRGLCKEHYSIIDPTTVSNKIRELSKYYDHVYCLTLSYKDTQSLHQSHSNDKDITIVGASEECIELLQNKQSMNNAAIEAGLPLLQNIDINGNQITKHFPLVLRPTNEKNASFKAEFIDSVKLLANYMNLDVVAQPFISGPNIVVHFAKFGDKFDFACFIVENKYEGVTLTLKKCSMIDSQLLFKVKLFLNNINFTGIGHIEFIKDETNENLYFLDFNGRFGGTSLKAATLGFNEFFLTLSHFMPSIFKKNINSNATMASNTLALLKCMKTTCMNKKDILDYPQKNKLNYFFHLIYLFIIGKNELRFPDFKIKKDYIYNFFKRKFTL